LSGDPDAVEILNSIGGDMCALTPGGCAYNPKDSGIISQLTGASSAPGQSPQPPPPPKPEQHCEHGVAEGYLVGGEAEAGVGPLGAAGQVGAGGAAFYAPGSGASLGKVFDYGAAVVAGSHYVGAPSQFTPPMVFGASAGASPVGLFVTNAGSAEQLAGPFETISANLGYFLKISGQLSIDANNTFVLSFSWGWGFGVSASAITTNTLAATVAGRGGC